MTTEFPARIGPYEVKARLGRKESRLYHAYDTKFGKDVVLKFLPPGFFSDPVFRARFEREMQVLSLSALPGVVAVEEVARENGQPYLVSRYLPGGSLEDLLASGPLTLGEAVSVTYQVALALDAAHASGVLHRNLKPSNILLDANGMAHLCDFGLVKRDPASAQAVFNPLDGAPAYTSPEQALGRADLDARSDVYSLGAVLFAMLTGQPPYPQSSPVRQAAQQITHTLPDMLEIRPNLPPGVQAVVAQAMNKNPEKRYATAGELANALVEASGVAINLASLHAAAQASILSSAPQSRFGILRAVLLVLTALVLVGASLGFYLGWFSGNLARKNLAGALNLALPTLTATSAPTTPTPTRTPILTQTPTSQPTVLPTPTPTITSSPRPTATSLPTTPTPPPTPLPPLVLGNADKIAFIKDNDIYVANLDGSDILALTSDGRPKTDLQWTPDGTGVVYKQASSPAEHGCYKLVRQGALGQTMISDLGCYRDIEISPDMVSVVIGDIVEIENKNFTFMNFIAPFDLAYIRLLGDVPTGEVLGNCPFRGGQAIHWSPDSQELAGIVTINVRGRDVDTVQVFNPTQCGQPNPRPLASFSAGLYLRGGLEPNYDRLDEFGWNGSELIAVHQNYLHGYGDMLIYNRSKDWFDKVNPIGGQCCYQDIQWSPDGKYLLFVYQDGRTGQGAHIYYIPINRIQTSDGRFISLPEGELQPMNLPEPFSDDAEARVEPALREYRP